MAINPDGTPATPGMPAAQTTNYLETTNTGQQGQTAGQSSAQNQYSAAQQALQNQIAGQYGGVLSGSQQVPAYFTAPQSVFDAYNSNFQKSVAPGIAAQFGAGSPQIGAQQSFGNQQLAAQLYQGGISNWLNSLAGAGNFASNPQGQVSTNTGTNQYDTNQRRTGVTSNTMEGSLLSLLLQLMGGG